MNKSKKLIDIKKSLSGSDISKSISISTTISDIKKSKSIGELYDMDELHNKMNAECVKKVSKKRVGNVQMDSKVSNELCGCLFDKNRNMTINQLEKSIVDKVETPGTHCIRIVDNYVSRHKSRTKSKSKSRSKSRSKSKSKKIRKSKSSSK